jgi:hypothetical protein
MTSLAAALALPEVVAAVDEFNELLPGVPISKENLAPMWDYLIQLAANGDGYELREAGWSIRVGIYDRTLKKPGVLHAIVYSECPVRTVIDWRRVPAAVDNLAEVLAWGKQVAQRVREGDFCDRCEAPAKKLRARPLPFCARCSLDVSLGAPAAKRRRGE